MDKKNYRCDICGSEWNANDPHNIGLKCPGCKGDLSRIAEPISQATSLLIRIHGDFFLDARLVMGVSYVTSGQVKAPGAPFVLNRQEGHFVLLLWAFPDKREAREWFEIGNEAQARQLVRDITERVNRGRYTTYKVGDVELPISLHELNLRSAEPVPEAAFEKQTPPVCTCTTAGLGASGCTCGAFRAMRTGRPG